MNILSAASEDVTTAYNLVQLVLKSIEISQKEQIEAALLLLGDCLERAQALLNEVEC